MVLTNVKTPLSIDLFPGWGLRNPIWVASADLTQNQAGIKSIINTAFPPGAITLKTTAPEKRRKFSATKKLRAHIRTYRDPFEPKPRAQTQPTLYCDGPPNDEYLSVHESELLLQFSKRSSPETKVGLSVLMGEDYKSIAADLLESTDFAELNLKYAARVSGGHENTSFLDAQSELFREVLGEIETFARVFYEVPVFIKVTREFPWLPIECKETKMLTDLLSSLAQRQRIGLIVANTRKQRVPNDLISNVGLRRERDDLAGGIVSGEQLYIETYNLVRHLTDCYPAVGNLVPIVATGGITTLSSILELMRAGAKSVQVYTALIAYGPPYLASLCADLAHLIQETNAGDYQRLFEQVRRGPMLNARELALLIPMRNRKTIQETLRASEGQAVTELLKSMQLRLRADRQKQEISRPLPPVDFDTADSRGLPALDMTTASSVVDLPPFEARVLSPESNVDANILLQFQGASSLRLHVEILARVEDVLSSIASGTAWDLAFLSEPYLRTLNIPTEDESRPVLLGRFFDAEYVLGGFEKLDDVDDIFNFGGPEAEHVLRALAGDHRRGHRTVKTDAALLWLHYDRQHNGLLAKDPLFTAYRMLSPNQGLQRLSKIPLPIYLIASKGFCKRVETSGLLALYQSLATSVRAASNAECEDQLASYLRSEAWKTWSKYLGVKTPEPRATISAV